MHLSILSSSPNEKRKIFPWYHDWVYSILLLYGWAPNIVLHNMQMTKGILSTPHHQGWMKKGPNLLLANLTLTFVDCAAFIPHLLLSVNVKFSEDSASGFCSHSILNFNFAYNNMYCNFGANSVDNLTLNIRHNVQLDIGVCTTLFAQVGVMYGWCSAVHQGHWVWNWLSISMYNVLLLCLNHASFNSSYVWKLTIQWRLLLTVVMWDLNIWTFVVAVQKPLLCCEDGMVKHFTDWILWHFMRLLYVILTSHISTK